MSDLKRRIEKLEKAEGTDGDWDLKLKKLCERGNFDYEQMRNALKGHEREIPILEGGYVTFKTLRIIAHYLSPVGA